MAQVLDVVTQPLAAEYVPLQLSEVLDTGEPVAAGHTQDVVRVPFSTRVRCCQCSPTWPAGQPTFWLSAGAVRVMATDVGEGATHAGAQVLETVVQGP
ncbi:hypothetical protein PK69_21255 [Xanthomonas phaseoli pv. phaseoli]|nr:hypothetical protein PK69_21255 [Xanthomonas phaseoli pv. phaseoli]